MANNNDALEIAARLRQARLAKGWTQAKLAEELGLPNEYPIRMYEENGIEPSLATMRRFAGLLEVPLEWLVSGHRCPT